MPKLNFLRHDNTGKLQPGFIGASNVQRQWIGLSLTGDSVDVAPLPGAPAPGALPYLESLDLEVGFLKKGHEIAEQFNADDMTKNFVKAFNGLVFSVGEILVFEYHGQNLKGTVMAVGTVELADAQRRGVGNALQNAGILMDKTDVSFIKAGDSAIKIKSSSKK